MSYLDVEDSDNDSKPIECYFFHGTYRDYLYTSTDQNVTFLGNEYEAVLLQRDAIHVGSESDDNNGIQMEVLSTLELVQDYAFAIAPPDLHLTIYRFHRDTPEDFTVIWASDVQGFTVNGHKTKIQITSLFDNMLNGQGPTEYYQSSCNNLLFGPKCLLNRNTNKITSTIVSIDENNVQVAASLTADGRNFRGGELLVTSSGERRTIVGYVDGVVGLSYAVSKYVTIGAAVEITIGCNHSLARCKQLGNSANFGGTPYIPNQNPFNVGF